MPVLDEPLDELVRRAAGFGQWTEFDAAGAARVDSYEELVRELCDLTLGVLELTSFRGVEGERYRTLELGLFGGYLGVEVRTLLGWFDTASLLRALNSLLHRRGVAFRFVTAGAPDAGASVMVAFVPLREVPVLLREGRRRAMVGTGEVVLAPGWQGQTPLDDQRDAGR